MTNAGRSATVEARRIRRAQPWWRRALVYLGLLQQPAKAANYDAGAAGEKMTAALIDPLTREGWHAFHDLPIWDRANVDHLLVPPHGRYVITLDSKLHSRLRGYFSINAKGRLVHGGADRHSIITTAKDETAEVARILNGIEARSMVVIHSAPVSDYYFVLDGVMVTSAEELLTILTAHAAYKPDRHRAHLLAHTIKRKFRRPL